MDSFIQHWTNNSNGEIISQEIDLQNLNLSLTFTKDKHTQEYSFNQSRLEQALKTAGVLEQQDHARFHMKPPAAFLARLEQFSQQVGAYSNKKSTAADVQVSFCSFVGAPTAQANFKENIQTLAANHFFLELDYKASKVQFLNLIAWDCFLVSLSKNGHTARVVIASDTD